MKTVYLIGCIKRDVMRWVQKNSPDNKVDLTTWYCGITYQENITLIEKKLTDKDNFDLCYRRWFANESIAAQEILGFFIKNGMKNKPLKGGYKNDVRYFYILKAQSKILDEMASLLS